MSEPINPEILHFEPADVELAELVQADIEDCLYYIEESERGLTRNYAELGANLLQVRSKRFWLLWGFPSFSKYIESIKDQIQKGRTQLYHCIAIAEKLLPAVSQEELRDMGITK